MKSFRLLVLVCVLALPFADAAAQTTKSDTQAILEGMSAMDAASVQAQTVQAHIAKKNYDAAIAELNKILQTRPTDANALLFRGLAYYHQKRFDLALADLNKIVDDPTSNVTGRRYALRGKVHAEKGNRDAALSDAINGLAFSPSMDEIHDLLMSLLTPEQYVGELSKAILAKERRMGGHYPLYARRAVHYIQLKQYDRAAPDIVNALKRDKNDTFDPKAWSFLDYYYQGKPDAYMTALDTIIKDSFSLPTEALKRRAALYYEQKKFDLAAADATRAINAKTQIDNVTVSRLYAIRGYSHAMAGKYELALADLNRVLASKFYETGDLDLRSQILCVTGKKAEAKEDEKKLIAAGGKVSKPCQ